MKKSPRISARFIRQHAGNRCIEIRKGKFKNVMSQAGVEMGRWAWCSDACDFDHTGTRPLLANAIFQARDLRLREGRLRASLAATVAKIAQSDMQPVVK